MKKIATIIAAISLASCGPEKKSEAIETANIEETRDPVAHGKELFEGAGNCFACHKADQKIIAPSIKEIADIYRSQNADMVEFLKGNGKPIVDPSQFEVMKTNFTITKTMTETELQALEAYMMSH